MSLRRKDSWCLEIANMKKLSVISFAVFVLLFAQGVSASVVINEIMYNPELCSDSYCEWVEIYNAGTESIDLANWTLCTKTLLAGCVDINGEIHLRTTTVLPSGSYAIITDGGTGTGVYDNFTVDSDAIALHVDASSLCGGLSNSGKTLTLEDDGETTVDSVDYDGSLANGDGKTLQLCDGSWYADTLTPGTVNECQASTECDDGICDEDENCTSCPEDCLDEGQVCCDDIAYDGNCCSDEDCISDETCESHVCIAQESEPEVNEINYNITLPDEIISEEEFEVKIEIDNNQNKSQGFEVWSYVYRSSKCYSCYWEKTRESNKQTVNLDARSLEIIKLKDKVNASEGEYNLKVKILKDGFLTPKEFTYSVTVAEKIETTEEQEDEDENEVDTDNTESSESSSSSDSSDSSDSSAENNGESEEKENEGDADAVYFKKENGSKVAVYLFIALLLLLVVYLIISKEKI